MQGGGELGLSAPGFAVLGGAASVAALFLWRFVNYSRLEYIKAAMLTNNIPRGSGGARVVQLGGGTKDLYYYPKDLQVLTLVGEQLNRSLIEQGGLQAGVPALVKRQSPADLRFQADGSADAVVSLYSLGPLDDSKRSACVAEAIRVLKPGRPFVFIERLNDGSSPLQGMLGSGAAGVGPQALEALRTNKAFDFVQWDVALQGQDPHAIGVAVKSKTYAPQSGKSRGSRRAATAGGGAQGFQGT